MICQWFRKVLLQPGCIEDHLGKEFLADMEKRSVVVTGLGVVSPVGHGIPAFWDAVADGRSGIGRVTHFDPSDFRSQLAGEVKDFEPTDWIAPKAAKRMDRFTQFAVAAANMALADADLEAGSFDGDRAGTIIGSGIGGSKTIEDGYQVLKDIGPKKLNPFFVSRLLVNMAACMVSITFGLKGPLSAPSVACSTGTNAIGDAFTTIRDGRADLMVAGAAEACVTPLAYGGFCAARAMTTNTDPATASRPFDKERDGFVMGEGAGIAVLESREHAENRGATIYAEVAGYGAAADAFHLTAPSPSGEGMARCMAAALSDAELAPGQVDYINAHGTSTVLNDKCESAAIQQVFGEYAANLKVSSIKSMIGHLMAASGAVEFAALVMSMKTGIAPPTINYREPDPDCPLDYVVNGKEHCPMRAAISNSFGFGGGNACLAVTAETGA